MNRSNSMRGGVPPLGNEHVVDYPKRGEVLSQGGMVSCSNLPSAHAGLEVLRRGGNAVDAAIAVGAAQNVVDPTLCHLGGDCFMLVYDAQTDEYTAVNGSGRSPERATYEYYREMGGVPRHGPLSSAVPGAVGAWATANERFGRLPFAELFGPAIRLSTEGFPVSPRVSRYLQRKSEVFREYPGSRAQYMPGGQMIQPGDVLRQPRLADTLQELAAGGAETFYRGELAGRLAAVMEELGGLISEDDLASHETLVSEPLAIDYRGFTVFQQPLVSQGILLLMALKIFEHFDVDEMDVRGGEFLHLAVETLRTVFTARDQSLGDPEAADVDAEELLSDAWASAQADRIRRALTRSQRVGIPGSRSVSDGGTDFFCVADGEGNFVTHIHSLYSGSGGVLNDTGIMMNSRMLGFSMDPDSPNVLAGGKRPLHTLNSYMVAADGAPVLVGGSTGGDLQIAFNLQIISNSLDRGMSIQRAIDAPRLSMREYDKPFFERRFPAESLTELRSLYPDLYEIGAWGATGRAQAISCDQEERLLIGACESRDDGSWCLGLY